jgi:hypothetical protein
VEKTNPKASGISELTALRQWVCWKRGKAKANGRFEKVPCDPFHPHYSMNVLPPGTHRSYDDALWLSTFHTELAEHGGIGFVTTEDDPYCFLDLDDCIDREADWIAPWVAEIVEELDSLFYITPSGKGIRIVVRGKLADGGGYYLYRDEEGDNHVIEAYDSGRMMTFADRVADKPIREAHAWLNGLTKVEPTSDRKGLGYDFPEVALDQDLDELRREVKRVLVSHELSPDPIGEGLRKITLISVGARLLMNGRTEDWLRQFLPKINATLLYNKNGQLEGLDEAELEEVFDVVTKLKPNVSPEEVQHQLDLVAEFLTLIRPRLKRAYNTDWSFLKALEKQGRKYGSIVNEDEVRIDGSWLTIQGLSRIASPKTIEKKISRLKKGRILRTGKDKKAKAGHFFLNVSNLLSGEYFGLLGSEIERMRQDSKVSSGIYNNPHCLTIHTHPFWVRQYGTAKGPLFAAIASLGGEGRTRDIALKMGRLDKNGKPSCGSISGLLRRCEKEGTLENPRRGYWRFSVDFEEKLHRARVESGEFDRDDSFKKHKEEKRLRYREQVREYLSDVDRQKKLFDSMLTELEKQNPNLASTLSAVGASKPTLVLGKYFVEGKRVTGIVEGGT